MCSIQYYCLWNNRFEVSELFYMYMDRFCETNNISKFCLERCFRSGTGKSHLVSHIRKRRRRVFSLLFYTFKN